MKLPNKKITSLIILTVFLFTILLPTVAMADEIPPFPAAYYGTLKSTNADGSTYDTPAGAVVKVFANGVEVGSIQTTKAGHYGDRGGSTYLLAAVEDGTVVRFFVNNIDTKMTSTTNSEKETKLDLIVPYVAEEVPDTTAPVISDTVYPAASTTNRRPEISASYSDSGKGVDVSKVELKLDGTAINDVTKNTTSISYTPTSDLSVGTHNVALTVYDIAGNKAEKTWSFTVTATTPTPTTPPTTPSTPPSSSGNGVVIAAPTYNETIKKADGTQIFTKSVDFSSNTAKAALTADDIKKALDSVTASAIGVKTVVIEMPDIKEATSYVQDFPAEALSGSAISTFIFKAGTYSVELKGDMFTAADIGSAKTISIKVEKADTTDLNKDVAAEIGNRPVVNLSAALDGKTFDWKNADTSITVSVKYAPSEAELKKAEHIAVRYIDANGKLEAISNGRYVAGTGSVDFKTTKLGKFAVVFSEKTFSDISKYKWAVPQIEFLAAKGITLGTSATTYSPTADITRYQYVVFLMRALGLDAKFDSNYSDVKETDGFYNILGAAKKLGITGEMPDNKFRPHDKITRQELMTYTARALELSGKLELDGKAEDLKSYADVSKVSSDAIVYVATLVKHGIINGKNLNPNDYATRAQMAVVIYRIYNL